MRRLRIWCTAFFAWLFVLYNIERLHEPINLASFVYVLSALIAVPLVVLPRLQRIPLTWLLGGVVPVIVGMKVWLGYPVAGRHLPITVTEIVSTWITISLALRMGLSLEELRKAALATLLTHLHDRSRPFEEGQTEIYREIRRARIHRRPLALLAVTPVEQSVEMSLDRFTLELQQESVRNYIQARLAELLSLEMKDCDIITHQGTHFVTLLPEAGRERAIQVAHHLQELAREKLGLDLRVGVSVFPEEEVTFVKLLERAQAQMQATAESEFGPATEPVDEMQAEWEEESFADRPLPASPNGSAAR